VVSGEWREWRVTGGEWRVASGAKTAFNHRAAASVYRLLFRAHPSVIPRSEATRDLHWFWRAEWKRARLHITDPERERGADSN